jgi:hypothetical protein
MFENMPILKITGNSIETTSINHFRCKNATHKQQMQNTVVDDKSIGLDIDLFNLNTM